MPAELRMTSVEIAQALKRKRTIDDSRPAYKRSRWIGLTVYPDRRYRPGQRWTRVDGLGRVSVTHEAADGTIDVKVMECRLEQLLASLEALEQAGKDARDAL